MAFTPSSPFSANIPSNRKASAAENYDPVAHGFNRVGDRVKITKNANEGEWGRIARFTPKMMYIQLELSGQSIIRNSGSIHNPAADKRSAQSNRPNPELHSTLENDRLTNILTELVLHVEFSGLGPRDRLARTTIARRYEDIIQEFEKINLN